MTFDITTTLPYTSPRWAANPLPGIFFSVMHSSHACITVPHIVLTDYLFTIPVTSTTIFIGMNMTGCGCFMVMIF